MRFVSRSGTLRENMRKACLGILERPVTKRLRMSVLQEKYTRGNYYDRINQGKDKAATA